MTGDVKRMAETYICSQLKLALPTMSFLPFSGGDDTSNAFDNEPPFGVVSVLEAEKTYQTEATYIANGTVQWITHLTESTPAQHSNQAQLVKNALVAIPVYQSALFSFHGIDISSTSRSEDKESRCRADLIKVTMGIGG